MNPRVRAVDEQNLLIKAKHRIETLMKQKQETVEVYLDLATFWCVLLIVD